MGSKSGTLAEGSTLSPRMMTTCMQQVTIWQEKSSEVIKLPCTITDTKGLGKQILRSQIASPHPSMLVIEVFAWASSDGAFQATR